MPEKIYNFQNEKQNNGREKQFTPESHRIGRLCYLLSAGECMNTHSMPIRVALNTILVVYAKYIAIHVQMPNENRYKDMANTHTHSQPATHVCVEAEKPQMRLPGQLLKLFTHTNARLLRSATKRKDSTKEKKSVHSSPATHRSTAIPRTHSATHTNANAYMSELTNIN